MMKLDLELTETLAAVEAAIGNIANFLISDAEVTKGVIRRAYTPICNGVQTVTGDPRDLLTLSEIKELRALTGDWNPPIEEFKFFTVFLDGKGFETEKKVIVVSPSGKVVIL